MMTSSFFLSSSWAVKLLSSICFFASRSLIWWLSSAYSYRLLSTSIMETFLISSIFCMRISLSCFTSLYFRISWVKSRLSWWFSFSLRRVGIPLMNFDLLRRGSILDSLSKVSVINKFMFGALAWAFRILYSWDLSLNRSSSSFSFSISSSILFRFILYLPTASSST